MQGLGYKEILAFLNGEHTMEEAVATLKRNTRRYAKRQLTWFRPDPRIRWIDVTNLTPTEVAATMASMLE
jgi:tRNA dimethylallyltransferase